MQQLIHLARRVWFGVGFFCIALLGTCAPPALAANRITGTVFEDINYGGGAGRNYAAANAAAVASGFANNLIQVPAGVRVELYNVNTGTGVATRDRKSVV